MYKVKQVTIIREKEGIQKIFSFKHTQFVLDVEKFKAKQKKHYQANKVTLIYSEVNEKKVLRQID